MSKKEDEIVARPSGPYFEIYLRAAHDPALSLFDFNNFLYDFNLGYEVARLATDGEYRRFRFSHNVYYRMGRPLQKEDRLRLIGLRLESPFEITIAVVAVGTAVGVIYGIVKLLEKAVLLPAMLRKARADAERAEMEAAEMRERRERHQFGPGRFEEQLQEREADGIFRVLRDRIGQGPFRVIEVRIRWIERPDGHDHRE